MRAMLPSAALARRRLLLSAVLWTVATALLLLVPLPRPVPVPPALVGLPWDKLAHALLFCGLGVSWLERWHQVARPQGHRWGDRFAVAAAVTAYGGLLELAQSGLGMGRQGEWGDLVADALGALAALWVVARL